MILIKDYEEKISKAKSFGLLITSIIFVVGGVWMIITPTPDSVISIFRIRFITILFGLCCALFFSLGIIAFPLQMLGYKLKSSRVIIGETGLTYYSKEFIIGHIPWIDIAEIKISTIDDKKYLTILVHNPTAYIDRQRTLSNRKEMEDNYKLTGSPINISSGHFSVGVDKLKMKIETKFIEYKKGSR